MGNTFTMTPTPHDAARAESRDAAAPLPRPPSPALYPIACGSEGDPARQVRDRSPDSVLFDPSQSSSWGPDGPKPLKPALSARSLSAPASCGDLNEALHRARDRGQRPKIRKSVSFHATVGLVRSESLSDLPEDEKHKIWYRSTDYSRFVHHELGRRKEMGVTSTSLIMPSAIAHHEVDGTESDTDMDWAPGSEQDEDPDPACGYSDEDSSSSDDSRPVRLVG